MHSSLRDDRFPPHQGGGGIDRAGGNAIDLRTEHTDDDDDDPVVEVVACPDCRRLVPPANLQMHQLRGCPARATHRHDGTGRPQPQQQQQQQQPQHQLQPLMAATHATRVFPPPQNPEYREDETGSTTATVAPPVPVVAGRIVSDSTAPTPQHAEAPPLFSSALGVPASRESHGGNRTPPDDGSSSPWDRPWSGALHTAFGCCTDGGATGDLTATAAANTSATATAAASSGGDPEVDGASYPAARRRRQRTSAAAPTVPAATVVNLVDSPVATAGSHDVIDLMDCDDNDAAAAATWACPRCTLLNPEFQAVCEACLYSRRNPTSVHRGVAADYDGQRCGATRAPDATRTDTLVPTFLYRPPNTDVADNDEDDVDGYSRVPPPRNASSASYVPSAALLGGVLGAAGALARGRPVARAALDGALGGAMGGMAVDAVVAQQQRDRDAAQRLRSSRARSQSNNHNNNRVRVFRTPHGVVTVSTGSSMGGTARTYATAAARSSDHLALDALFHQSLLAALSGGQGFPLVGGAANQHNPDGMTYDQLLQRFGDGTDNLGANPEQIASLPTLVVRQDKCGPGQPPAERCSICLQDFCAGETCKTLPCWHSGFHADCLDQWLRTNAACPICKHRLE